MPCPMCGKDSDIHRKVSRLEAGQPITNESLREKDMSLMTAKQNPPPGTGY